eukprot:1967917-Rhodomonas_salina.2
MYSVSTAHSRSTYAGSGPRTFVAPYAGSVPRVAPYPRSVPRIPSTIVTWAAFPPRNQTPEPAFQRQI